MSAIDRDDTAPAVFVREPEGMTHVDVGRHAGEPEAQPDDYDALADLFLGDALQEPEQGPYPFVGTPESQHGRTIEGLLVGHLPVLASAWISQYARHKHRTSGRPVALMHCRAGRVRIDLHASGRVDPCECLEHALDAANAIGAVWLLHVDEIDEPSLAQTGLDEITLLTGADQAAIVACYRVIKRVVGASGDVGSHIRIAAMGAGEQEAARLADAIGRASSAFLGYEVELTCVAERIEPGCGATIFEGEAGGSVDQIVTAIGMGDAATAPVSITADVQTPEAHAPIPTRDDSPRESLASCIPGLSPLGVTSPPAPGVELARDESGRLHLVAGADGADALARLLAARQWAVAHASLLHAACAGLDASRPRMHLVTHDARAVRPLLDTDVSVHLVAHPAMGGVLCAPLN